MAVRYDFVVDTSETVRKEDDGDEAILQQTLAKISGFPVNVVAVLAGDETGAELALKLSEALGVPNNGERSEKASFGIIDGN